jgi:hypothetical protein
MHSCNPPGRGAITHFTTSWGMVSVHYWIRCFLSHGCWQHLFHFALQAAAQENFHCRKFGWARRPVNWSRCCGSKTFPFRMSVGHGNATCPIRFPALKNKQIRIVWKPTIMNYYKMQWLLCQIEWRVQGWPWGRWSTTEKCNIRMLMVTVNFPTFYIDHYISNTMRNFCCTLYI